METTEILTEEQAVQEQQESDELIEIVKERHGKKEISERVSDVFTMQLILCVILVLAVAVLNIFDKSISEWLINEFKEKTMGETEKIIKDAVTYAVSIIR